MTATTGEKRSASPPEGGGSPAKKVAVGPPQRRWDFTKIEDIPQSIRAKNVAKFSVEIIHKGDADDEPPTNHTITRLTFQHKQEHDTAYLVAGTTGLTIDFHMDLTDPTHGIRGGGDVLVKTFTYDGVHERAVYAYDVPIRAIRRGKSGRKLGKTVKDFLKVISVNGFVPCSFNFDGDAVGCKDFTSQYIYRLNEAKVLDIPAAAAPDFFDRFNYNHTLPYVQDRGKQKVDYKTFKVNVGHAIWNTTYYENHVDIPGIVYVGRRLNWDPATGKMGGADLEPEDLKSITSRSQKSADSRS